MDKLNFQPSNIHNISKTDVDIFLHFKLTSCRCYRLVPITKKTYCYQHNVIYIFHKFYIFFHMHFEQISNNLYPTSEILGAYPEIRQ